MPVVIDIKNNKCSLANIVKPYGISGVYSSQQRPVLGYHAIPLAIIWWRLPSWISATKLCSESQHLPPVVTEATPSYLLKIKTQLRL